MFKSSVKSILDKLFSKPNRRLNDQVIIRDAELLLANQARQEAINNELSRQMKKSIKKVA